MRHLLNTLFVTTQGAYLSRDGETILVQVEDETRLRVPIHTLGGIVCFGRVSCSPHVMRLCAERSVLISFLSEHGRFWARVQGPVRGNVLLRREQYRWADDDVRSTETARAIVTGKIANCRTVLLRALRDHAEAVDGADLRDAATKLASVADSLRRTNGLDALRGCEGDASRTYFAVFDHLILAQKEHFFFRGRTRRPPLDRMNALLSFLYTLVVHDVESALEVVGLDPTVGFLHRDRPGRPGLALDLMEELRSIFADRLALSLVNRRQISEKGFRTTESGAVLMDDETRRTVLVAYQERKQEEVQHPFLGESLAAGLVPYIQALLLARHIRGDIDGYPPFLWR